jgi:nitrilase
MYPSDLPGLADLADLPEVLCRGGSAIISPLGEELAGPLYDKEGILYAELDMGEIIRARFDFDVVGHYARPDVLRLHVNARPQQSVTYRSPDDGDRDAESTAR